MADADADPEDEGTETFEVAEGEPIADEGEDEGGDEGEDEGEGAQPKSGRPVPDTRHSISPRLLPDLKCDCDDELERESKKVELTEEMVINYAGAASLVGWKGRVDYALDYLEKDAHLDAKLLAHLLESVISTVILMASGGEPDEERLISSVLYLRYIRNEFGKYPHNIAGLLEYMKTKFTAPILEELEAIGDPERDEMPPKHIITQIPSSIQEKICKHK